MNRLILQLTALVALLSIGEGHDLILGTFDKDRLIWQHKVELTSSRSKNRIKYEITEVSFDDPQKNIIIKGIKALDLDHSRGKATVTSGGIGYSYVKLRLRSARRAGLNYNIEIYA